MTKKSFLVKTVLMSMLTAVTFSFASCSDDDDMMAENVMYHKAGAEMVAKPITGVWYAAYKASGTAVSDNNDGKSIDYAHAFDVYEFHEDGTGSFHRHFISEGDRTPELSWGKEGKGDFTYTSTADGQVKVTLRNGQGLPYDGQWSMNYREKDGNIVATGADNSNITLTPASESIKEVFDEWNDDTRHATRYAAAAAGAGSINKPGIDIIDTYGLLVRFTGALLGKYGEGYICGMMVGDHRELVEIPEFLNCGLINAPLQYRIIGIDSWAFRGHNHIKRLTIAPSVLYIGREAFKNCTGLVDVQLNPVELGDGAFKGCTALESVNISDASTLNKIGKDCFNGCTRLSSFQFPLTVNVIGDRAFKGCSNLMSATFGMHLTTIGKETFSGCSKLLSVYFPSQLETIDDEAFRYCVKLVSIDIPIGIRKIGKKAFADCSKLSSVSPYQFEYHTEMATDAFEHTPMLHKPTVKK